MCAPPMSEQAGNESENLPKNLSKEEKREVEKQELEKLADRRERRRYVWILVGFTLLIGVLAAWYAAYAPRPITNALPAWLIVGLVVFMLVLTLALVVSKSLNIADPHQALGLPEGSIRAIIALLLILLFFLVAFNLFGYLRNIQTSTIPNLTQAQVAAIPGSEIKSIVPNADNPENFDVERITGPTPAAQDFAKQLLTTLSTLVVAIAAFYFGSSSTVQAYGAGRAEAEAPKARKSEPPKVPAAPQEGEAAGSGPSLQTRR